MVATNYMNLSSTATNGDYATGTTCSATAFEYEGRYIERTIEVKRKRKPRRYYVYKVDKYKSIVIASRSVNSADTKRNLIAKITKKFPERIGVEDSAKRVRTIMADYKGEHMESWYGVFLFRNVKLNKRKILL